MLKILIAGTLAGELTKSLWNSLPALLVLMLLWEFATGYIDIIRTFIDFFRLIF